MASCPDFNGEHYRGDVKQSFGIHSFTGLANCFGCNLHMNLEQLTANLLSRELGHPVNEYEAWLWLEQHDWSPKEMTPEDLKLQLDKLGKKSTLDILPDSILADYKKHLHSTIIKSKHITLEAAKEWELHYDPVSRRTIIPVRNFKNELVGIISRAVDDDNYIKHSVGVPQPPDANGEIHVKYAFDKGLVVFGENKAYMHKRVLVVESPLDVIYAWSYGVQKRMDILAIMGVKPTVVHIERLLPYDEVIIAMDQDDPGEMGKETLIKNLSGKVKLFTFDNFGLKDLGVVPYELLDNLEEHFIPYLSSKVANLELKLD
jgi:DNA primase